MSLRSLTLALVTGVAVMALGAGPAMAKEFRVDDDGAQCPDRDFNSIQAAVNAAAASPGKDKVKVCPGLYPEQVRITGPAQDGLKLEAKKKAEREPGHTPDPQEEAIIQWPATESPPLALVDINGADKVTLEGFVVRGPYTLPGVLERHTGVLVEGGATDVHIHHNRITQIRMAGPASGFQEGDAVSIGRRRDNPAGPLPTPGTGKVDHNLIEEYQKNGVQVVNPGSHADVDHNEIIGSSAGQAIIASNGVVVFRGASGKIDHNDVSNNQFTPDPQSAGILLLDVVPDTRADHNDVFDNDNGISLNGTTDTEISHNETFDNVDDGLFADSDTADNEFKDNRSFGNGEHDCHDDSVGGGTAGTANEWKGNRGNTQNRPGLCKDATTTP